MLPKSLKIGYLKFIGWAFIGFLIVAVIFFIYLPNYTKLKKLKQENARLNVSISSLKEEIGEFKTNIERLENESFIWEKLARQNIGVVKDGEIIVDITQQSE